MTARDLVVVEIPGRLTAEQVDRIREQMVNVLAPVRPKVVILDDGATLRVERDIVSHG